MKIDDLLPDLLPDVPGCPRATARDHLRRAAQQFARDTHAWEVELDRFTPSASYLDYRIRVPELARVVAITSVLHDSGGKETPVGHIWRPPMIVLADKLSSGKVIVRGVLEPDDAATAIDDALAYYRDAILDYARMRLLMMPRQEWTNPELGFAFRRQYETRVIDARIEVQRGGTTQSLRVQAHPFV